MWTTTPWTLPSNLALAVGPDVEYAGAVEQRRASGVRRSRARAARAYAKELADATPVGTVTGADLVGRRYTPLFDFLVDRAGPNAFQVLAGDFVTTEDGTGVVHWRRRSVRRTRTSATRPASRRW